jgi:hypothetical protein
MTFGKKESWKRARKEFQKIMNQDISNDKLPETKVHVI